MSHSQISVAIRSDYGDNFNWSTDHTVTDSRALEVQIAACIAWLTHIQKYLKAVEEEASP